MNLCSIPPPFSSASPCAHTARLYDDDAALADHLADDVHRAATEGQAVALIAVRSHTEAVLARLAGLGWNTQRMIESGKLILADAAECMVEVMRTGHPDRVAFEHLARDLIERGGRFSAGLFIYGEIVDLLWQQGEMDAANEIERWWNALIAEHRFTLLCGYRAHALDERGQDVLEAVCATHTHVIPAPDNERFEHAVEKGFHDVFPHADLAIVQQQLAEQCRHETVMPAAQAAMLGLRRVLPSVANLVRLESQKHFNRSA